MNLTTFKIHFSYKPVCLYTYETCSVRDTIITILNKEGDDNYDYIEALITKHFGRDKIDNKITIGLSVHFFVNVNSYRVVLPVLE